MTVGNQGATYGFSSWIPYHGNEGFIEDDFDRRTHLGPAHGLVPHEIWNALMMDVVIPQEKIDELSTRIDWAAFRRAVAEWRLVADDFFGDFYPLTEYSLDGDKWIAWQFFRPETGKGLTVTLPQQTQSALIILRPHKK